MDGDRGLGNIEVYGAIIGMVGRCVDRQDGRKGPISTDGGSWGSGGDGCIGRGRGGSSGVSSGDGDSGNTTGRNADGGKENSAGKLSVLHVVGDGLAIG